LPTAFLVAAQRVDKNSPWTLDDYYKRVQTGMADALNVWPVIAGRLERVAVAGFLARPETVAVAVAVAGLAVLFLDILEVADNSW
jgi:hypothetical protein